MFNKKIKRIAAFFAAIMCITAIGNNSINSLAAAIYSKASTGTYQLFDGTSISGVVARGIDVSHWQGDIDWKTAAADDVSFVMLGTRYKGELDPLFIYNATEAAKNGVKLGVYIYSYATDTEMAAAEADFVLDLIKDYPISYPVAFDVEDSVQSVLPQNELMDIIDTFCSRISDAGYYPMLYANDYWLANKIDLSKLKYDVWVARYEIKHSFENPTMWQATSTGSVAGVPGNVDIDFQYKDYSDIIHADTWRTIAGNTYYYKNHIMQKDAWINDGNNSYYMNSEGGIYKGWRNEESGRYYLYESTGAMATGWSYISDKWYYFAADKDNAGRMRTGWVEDGGLWYFMSNETGIMQTGWLNQGGKDYYLKSTGAMVTGWRQLENNWYYFDGSGVKDTGWVNDNGTWYYMNEAGVMQTGLLETAGVKYYLDTASGAMAANTTVTVDGVTYNADGSGALAIPEPETEPTSESTLAPDGTEVSETSAAVETSAAGETSAVISSEPPASDSSHIEAPSSGASGTVSPSLPTDADGNIGPGIN